MEAIAKGTRRKATYQDVIDAPEHMVYQLEAGRWVRVAAHVGDEKVHAEPFAAVELDMTLWWPPQTAPEAAAK